MHFYDRADVKDCWRSLDCMCLSFVFQRLPSSLHMKIEILTGMKSMLLANISGICTMIQGDRSSIAAHVLCTHAFTSS